MTAPLSLSRASLDDLPFIMATERRDGYDALVGRWPQERHCAALAEARYAYFVGRLGEEPVGFAILRDWASPERVVLLQRIAVTRPGEGLGRRFLKAIVERVFAETDAHRFCLGLFPHNIRALRTYTAVGFVPEGVARGSAYFGGENRDELIMALLRTDAARSAPLPG